MQARPRNGIGNRAARAVIVCGCALGLGACSLMQLDEFGGSPCKTDADCNAANERAGLSATSACTPMPYSCDGESGLCKRTSRKEQTCDGIDNDCDGRIDEGWAVPASQQLAPQLSEPNPSQISHALGPDGRLYLMLTYRQGEHYHSDALALPNDGPVFGTEATECANAGVGETCNFSQVAIAAAPSALFGVGINRTTCGAGQVRVSAGSPVRSQLTLDLGKAPADSSMAYGIDLDSSTSNRCTKSAACDGARDPAIAALPSADAHAPAQALALWLALNDDPSCADFARSTVAGLGLWVEPDAAGSLRGTRGGRSERILEDVGGVPPAVVAFAGADGQGGYIVGAPRADSIALAFVPSFGGQSSGDSGVELLSGAARIGSIPAGGVSRLALAVDPAGDGSRGLAAVWRTGPESGAAIEFSALGFDRAAEAAFSERGGLVKLRENVAISDGPVITYVPSGFDPGGKASGGWLVAWIEGTRDAGRLMGARIADSDERLLGQPEELASGALQSAFVYTRASAEPAASEAVYAYLGSDSNLLGGTAVCRTSSD